MILARYLAAQFMAPFLFGLGLFSGVLLLDKIFDLIDLLVNKGVSLGNSLQIFFLFMPTVMSLSVPMSLLLACLLTFGRLSEDNEILALRASGLSFVQILWPPLLVAVVLSFSLIPFNTQLTPAAMNRFRTLYHRIAATDPLIQIEAKRFVTLQNVRLFATGVSKDRKSLSNVWIYRHFNDSSERIYARGGTATVTPRQLSLRLTDGQLERFMPGSEEDFLHVNFEEYWINVPFLGTLDSRNRAWREYPNAELKKAIADRAAARKPTSELVAELHLRYAIAFAPLALALVGIPLGITMERGGRGVGFGASIGVLFLYYLVLIMGLNVAERDKLPAPVALWIANVAAAGVGVWLYRRRVAS